MYEICIILVVTFYYCNSLDEFQLDVRKCNECGQVLPESFEPPADEPWTTGIFGCTEDPQSCKFPYA